MLQRVSLRPFFLKNTIGLLSKNDAHNMHIILQPGVLFARAHLSSRRRVYTGATVADDYVPLPGAMSGRGSVFQWLAAGCLFVIGLLLEALYLSLYHFFWASQRNIDPALHAYITLSPHLNAFYQLVEWPVNWLIKQSWLQPLHRLGWMNGQLLVFLGAWLLMLIAVRVGGATFAHTSSSALRRLLIVLVLGFGTLFALTMLLAPVALNVGVRDLVLANVNGRLVVNYHMNPYTADLIANASLNHDPWVQLLHSLPETAEQHFVGPVWLDICILMALLVRDSVTGFWLGMRVLGVIAVLLTTWLIGIITRMIRSEQQLTGMLCYAWNPLILLFGIGFVHQEIMLGLVVALAYLFYIRNERLIGWFFIILAFLINIVLVILTPLLIQKTISRSRKSRREGVLKRVGRLLLALWLAAIMLVLAYLPFWQNWGIKGGWQDVLDNFWPGTALNSFVSALLYLPMHMPPLVMWPFFPHHWMLGTLIICGLWLLFSLWMIDNSSLLIVCSCWLMILLVILEPVYWPWYLIVPLVLGLSSAQRHTIWFLLCLVPGGLGVYYYWSDVAVWNGQGLVVIGVPCLLWGWWLFLTATWRRAHSGGVMQRTPLIVDDEDLLEEDVPGRPVRPPWYSRPSRPPKTGQIRGHLETDSAVEDDLDEITEADQESETDFEDTPDEVNGIEPELDTDFEDVSDETAKRDLKEGRQL